MNTANDYSETTKRELSDMFPRPPVVLRRKREGDVSASLTHEVPPPPPPGTEGYAKEAGQWLDAAYTEFPNHRRQLPYPKASVFLPTYPGKQDVNCYR